MRCFEKKQTEEKEEIEEKRIKMIRKKKIKNMMMKQIWERTTNIMIVKMTIEVHQPINKIKEEKKIKMNFKIIRLKNLHKWVILILKNKILKTSQIIQIEILK